jgi:transmembrane sensor
MSEVVRLRTLAEIEEEAAAWVWRLDDSAASDEVRRAFADWISRDTRHRPAYDELNKLWRSLDALAEAESEEKIATLAAAQVPQRRTKRAAPRRYGRTRRFVASAIAASLLLAAVGVYWFHSSNEEQTLATAVGQQLSAKLADGSMVDLNTNTIIETKFQTRRRDIELRKGEALFKVAHDTQRPFYVHAGNTIVRAVGTEFNVRLRDGDEVEVTVAEGRVEVVSGDSSSTIIAPSDAAPVKPKAAAHETTLDVGQRLSTKDAAAPVETINPVRLRNALAWREGAIVFDGERLSRAVEELNRYTDMRLVVTDPSIADLRIGGRFSATDVDDFLRALSRVLPVQTRRAPTGRVVYIEPRNRG